MLKTHFATNWGGRKVTPPDRCEMDSIMVSEGLMVTRLIVWRWRGRCHGLFFRQ